MNLHSQVALLVSGTGYSFLRKTEDFREVWRCGQHLVAVPMVILSAAEANEVLAAAGIKYRFADQEVFE